MGDFINKSRQYNRLVAALLVIVLLAVSFWLFWVGDTRDIEATADKFNPGPEWSLVSNVATPPRTLCVDGSCPSLDRTWHITHNLTKEEVTSITRKTSWNMQPEDPCFYSSHTNTAAPTCYFHGSTPKYTLVLRVKNATNPTDTTEATLTIREK